MKGPKANGISQFIIDTMHFQQENIDSILNLLTNRNSGV